MKRYLLLLLGSFIITVLDQWSKLVAVRALALPGGQFPEDPLAFRASPRHVVFEGWFNFRLAGNKGAAWSIFHDLPDTLRVPFFVALTSVAIVAIFYMYRHSHSRLSRISLTLILGGAIGNLIDRVRLGYVVDFIQWYYQSFYWPTFNVADIAISVGVGLMIIDMLRSSRAPAPKADADAPQGAEQGETPAP